MPARPLAGESAFDARDPVGRDHVQNPPTASWREHVTPANGVYEACTEHDSRSKSAWRHTGRDDVAEKDDQGTHHHDREAQRHPRVRERQPGSRAAGPEHLFSRAAGR